MSLAPADVMERRSGSRHMIAAATAVTISVVVHVTVIFYLAKATFGYVMLTSDLVQDRRARAMKLHAPIRNIRVGNRPRRGGVTTIGRGNRNLATEAAKLGLMPDKVTLNPPALTDRHPLAESASIAGPSDVPRRSKWQARREMLVVESRVVDDTVKALTRRTIPAVERSRVAPDIANPVDVRRIRALAPAVGTTTRRPGGGGGPGGGLKPAVITTGTVGGDDQPTPAVVAIRDPDAEDPSTVTMEPKAAVTDYQPVEDLLIAKVSTYHQFSDFKYSYFRIEIDRAGADLLPVIPKDVVFVQDSSASMAETRLYFCRQGLTNALSTLGKHDRFNVISFRDSATQCFEDWVDNRPAAVAKATGFIQGLTSTGETDIFASIRGLVNLKRVPGRPVIAIVITDGRSTTGMTRSSDIIGEFSKLNNGDISVFTMGAMKLANTYLLDLLSYCNRGDYRIADGGRFGIPESLSQLAAEVRRPVLSEMRCYFSQETPCAVYPVLTSNLYLDRTYVLHGRCPKGSKKVLFRVKGKAGKEKCDMIFDLDLGKETQSRDKSIRENWARQKIFHLMGEHARKPNADTLKAIRETARKYGVRIPHRGEL